MLKVNLWTNYFPNLKRHRCGVSRDVKICKKKLNLLRRERKKLIHLSHIRRFTYIQRRSRHWPIEIQKSKVNKYKTEIGLQKLVSKSQNIRLFRLLMHRDKKFFFKTDCDLLAVKFTRLWLVEIVIFFITS